MSLLQMSFLGTVIILLIVVLRAVLINRLPKKTFLILWWIALIRLLVPFSIKSVTSIYSLLQSIYSDINPARRKPSENGANDNIFTHSWEYA